MPNPTNPDLGAILTDMRDTGLKWLADAADTIEQALTPEWAVHVYIDGDNPDTIDSVWPTEEAANKRANKLSALHDVSVRRRLVASEARPVGEIEVVE